MAEWSCLLECIMAGVLPSFGVRGVAGQSLLFFGRGCDRLVLVW